MMQSPFAAEQPNIAPLRDFREPPAPRLYDAVFSGYHHRSLSRVDWTFPGEIASLGFVPAARTRSVNPGGANRS
jgi:hypothetical protein